MSTATAPPNGRRCRRRFLRAYVIRWKLKRKRIQQLVHFVLQGHTMAEAAQRVGISLSWAKEIRQTRSRLWEAEMTRRLEDFPAPSETEVRERCQEIQATWDEPTRRLRDGFADEIERAVGPLRSGDACPKCGGRLFIGKTRIRGEVRVRRLTCSSCRYWPPNNEIIVPRDTPRRGHDGGRQPTKNDAWFVLPWLVCKHPPSKDHPWRLANDELFDKERRPR